MSLAEGSLTSDVRQHVKVEIERKIFDAAVLGFKFCGQSFVARRNWYFCDPAAI